MDRVELSEAVFKEDKYDERNYEDRKSSVVSHVGVGKETDARREAEVRRNRVPSTKERVRAS